MHSLSVISNLAGRTMRKRDGWWLNSIRVELGKARKHQQRRSPRRRASAGAEETGPPEHTPFGISKVVSAHVTNCIWNLSLPVHFCLDSGKTLDHGCIPPASPVSL